LNGAASEATSIYDARSSIFVAYRTLFRQWDLVFAIGAANRKRGCAPTGLVLVWQKWREYSRLAAPTRRRIDLNHVHRHVHRATTGYCLGMNRDEKLTRPTGLPQKRRR